MLNYVPCKGQQYSTNREIIGQAEEKNGNFEDYLLSYRYKYQNTIEEFICTFYISRTLPIDYRNA
jgi:hypothetical protein